MLRIAGIEPFSTVDWPGKLTCVAFLAGCPWACPYCQNHAIRRFEVATLGEENLFDLLEQRRGLLDGVVFSGGEPLAQEGVVQAARHARELGFAVGLHTCGAYPHRLAEVLPYLNWVGLDVKAPWDAYDEMTRVPGSGDLARQSLELLLGADLAFEARTTWHPDLLSADDLSAIAFDLAARGVDNWAVQAYRSLGTSGELADRTVQATDVPADLPSAFGHYEFR